MVRFERGSICLDEVSTECWRRNCLLLPPQECSLRRPTLSPAAVVPPLASARNMAPRRRYSRIENSDSDSDGGDSGGDDGAPAPGGALPDKGWAALSEMDQNAYAATIMRHCLARHSQLGVTRRSELSKALFPAGSAVRARQSIFAGAFKLAQADFQQTYGLELLEVSKQTRAARGGSATQTQTARATQVSGSASQAGGGGAKGYILVSILPLECRALKSEVYATRAFLGIVAALITLTPECRIEEDELDQALQRAAGAGLAESKGHTQLNGGNVHELVTKTLVSQWYLEREKEDRRWYYRMGPRLRVELSDDSLIQFITAIYNLGAEQQNEMDPTMRRELQQRLDAARGVQLEDDDPADMEE